MALSARDLLGAFSSAELPTAAPERYDDIERKQRRIIEFLSAHDLDALLLQKPQNFAWFTSGGDVTRGGGEATAALFITSEARVIVGSNTDCGQLFDREVMGLGFQLKERPWFESKGLLLGDLCRGRKVGSDTGFPGTRNVAALLTQLRVPLSEPECERMRKLGAMVAHAVEATARNLQGGNTEAEIAGEMAHRLIKHQIVPVRLQVLADGRGKTYRHWAYGTEPVRRWCTLAAVGSQYGMCAAAVRTVSLGAPHPSLSTPFQQASMVHATAMYFSQVVWELGVTLDRMRRIYEKMGQPEEWRLSDQGCVIGYDLCEVPVVPESKYRLAPRTALHWHPSLGPALVGDTILISQEGFEVLTPFGQWPTLEVAVKETPIALPDILVREV